MLLGVDVPGVVDLARAHDAVIRLRTRVGDYAAEGTRLFDVIGGPDLDFEQLGRMVDFGRERTLYQDALYGIRQLVDTAAQALSAAINAPTTAVQVIDRLVDLVARIGMQPDPTGYVADEDGHVRYIHIVATWDDVVALAFTEIRQFGRSSSQVTRRLMSAFDEVSERVPVERRHALEAQRRALVEDVMRVIIDPDDRLTALQPDSMGLG